MNDTTYRLARMRKALDYSRGFQGNERVQRNQLSLIIHDAQIANIPVIDWLCEQFSQLRAFTPGFSGPSTDQPYRCQVCDKSFKSRAAFNGHQRVHKKGGAHE